MKTHVIRMGIPVMAIALCGFAAAQTAPQGPQLVSANAQLDAAVDSANATQGETISARLTSDAKSDGGVDLPKGTTLVGKVAQVQKADGNLPGQLTVVFDQAKLRNGQTVPIKATLLSAYPADDDNYWNATGEGGSPVPDQPHVIPATIKIDQEPGLLSHVTMKSDASSDASGVFTNAEHNVNLKRGTHFQIAVAAEGGSQTQRGN